MKPRFTLTYLAAAFLFCALSRTEAFAQSSVMNVPSTDIVAAKRVYLEMDFITNYAWARGDERFANYLPRAVVGVGRNVEVGANFSYTRVPGGGEPIELQPNAKWQFYNNEEKGLAASVGCIWFVPITHRSGTDTFGQCYTVASKKFDGNYGPKFTGGAYRLVDASDDQGTKTGAILAYEQPLTKKVGFIVDWSSGNNRLGFVSPGIYILTPRNGSLSAGYAIANQGRGKNALFVYYGAQF
jgi:hypothetical protein